MFWFHVELNAPLWLVHYINVLQSIYACFKIFCERVRSQNITLITITIYFTLPLLHQNISYLVPF